MPVVARTITVEAPAPAVWRFVSDFVTTEEWDPPTVSTERTGGDGGVGTTYHNVAKFCGRRTEVDYLVTEHEPGTSIALRGSARGLVMLVRICVRSQHHGRTEVTYENRLTVLDDEAPPFGEDDVDALGSLVAESLLDSLEHLQVDH